MLDALDDLRALARETVRVKRWEVWLLKLLLSVNTIVLAAQTLRLINP